MSCGFLCQQQLESRLVSLLASELFSADVNQTQRSVWVTNLPEGAKVLLIVRSLANGSLEGGAVNVSDVTGDYFVFSLH